MGEGRRHERGGGHGSGGPAGAALAGAGAAATAGAAAACCVPVVSPLLVAVLGASGAAWITGLEPWAPYLLAAALLLLIYAAWSLRRSRACAHPREREAPRAAWRRAVDRATPVLLVLAAVVWAASVLAFVFFS